MSARVRRSGTHRPTYFGADITEDIHQVMVMLIRERRRRGVTGKQLAQRMGITQPTLANMESLIYLPSLANLMRYARALGLKLNITLTEQEDQCDEP